MKTYLKNSNGFGTVGIAVLVGAIALAGVIGYLVYAQNKSGQTWQAMTRSTVTPSPTPITENGYLVIKEWGVKIKMKDADKVTYDYDDAAFTDARNGESADSSIGLKVNPELLEDKTCDASVGWYRYENLKSAENVKDAKKIGDFYFISAGSPYNCGNESDNDLNKSIREQASNLEAL